MMESIQGTSLNLLTQGILSYIATYGFGIVFNVKGRKIHLVSAVGAIGWITFIVSRMIFSTDMPGYFISSVVISCLSEWTAIRIKTPVTTTLICAMIPLVPGGGMYNTMYQVVNNLPGAAFKAGVETVSAAGALAIGVVFATAINKYFKGINGFVRKRRYYGENKKR